MSFNGQKLVILHQRQLFQAKKRIDYLLHILS